MGYFSLKAECFECGKNLSLMTARSRFELKDGKWICTHCAKGHGMNSLKIKKLTSEEVMAICKENLGQLENMDSNAIYGLKGTAGKTIQVFEDKCIITTKAGVDSFIVGNVSDGEKTIYYADVIGIQFKKSGIQIGYLQLETASSVMDKKENNFFNENSFTFIDKEISNEKMEEIKNYITDRIEIFKNREDDAALANASSADEILKFKKLCDDGIITKDEFEKKKQQLLDL